MRDKGAEPWTGIEEDMRARGETFALERARVFASLQIRKKSTI